MTLNSMGVMSVWGLAWGYSNLCQSLPSLLWPSVNDLLVCNQLSSSPHTTEVKAVALQTAVAFAPLVQLEREPDSLLVVTVSPTLTFQGWHVRVLVSTVCFDTIRPSTSTVLWQGCLWTRCELFKQLLANSTADRSLSGQGQLCQVINPNISFSRRWLPLRLPVILFCFLKGKFDIPYFNWVFLFPLM